jgi:hypothetical protein
VHSLVRRFIKTAIAFLFTGLAIGAWMLVRRVMMILGVALWMFPRAPKDDPRYRPSWIRAAWWLATLGTAVRVAGELARPMVATRGARWLVVASGLAQGFGIALFFVAMWPRIRAAGSATREAQGERF